MAPLLLLTGIGLTFGGTPTLENADLALSAGERIALVGRNGSGKSTLLRIAAGLVEPDRGIRFLQPGTTLRYLPQEPDLSRHATVRDVAEAGLGPGDDRHRAAMLLDALGLDPDASTARLSGGEARRAALAGVLAARPDILLLDEPTNHLDLPTIEWLEETLKQSRSALVLISHDRRFLGDLSEATVWLDRGRTRRLDRGFAAFEGWRDKLIEEEESERHKLDRKIADEEHWLRHGVSARRKRNMRRVAALADLRRQRREARHAVGSVSLAVTEARESGRLVIEAAHLEKSFGDRMLVRDLSVRIAKGDRLCIIGPNGAGKTTLLNLLIGRLAPDKGSVKLGAGLQPVIIDQKRAMLDPALTLADAIGDRSDFIDVGGERKHVIGYMKDFLFDPAQARTPLAVLSGGERARVALARILATPSNLLILDEPTNDLDLETLDLLQERVADYPGTVIAISHDRDFIDRIATSVLAAEGSGRWVEYAGGYSDMLAQRGGTPTRAEPPAKTAGAPNAPAPRDRPPPRKLSFKDKHALDTLPARIDGLTAEAAAMREAMADPDLFQRDPKRFAAVTARLATLDAEIAAAEEEWLRLEMLREELGG